MKTQHKVAIDLTNRSPSIRVLHWQWTEKLPRMMLQKQRGRDFIEWILGNYATGNNPSKIITTSTLLWRQVPFCHINSPYISAVHNYCTLWYNHITHPAVNSTVIQWLALLTLSPQLPFCGMKFPTVATSSYKMCMTDITVSFLFATLPLNDTVIQDSLCIRKLPKLVEAHSYYSITFPNSNPLNCLYA